MLANRRSRRDFAAPATLDDLAALLELCCRTRELQASDLGFDLEFRPHPSAGAIHSVHTLVQRQVDEDWMYYDAQAHQLVSLPNTSDVANAARNAANELVPAAKASLVALVAEPDKAAAKYQNPGSLIWRDAGVLLGYFSICAEALALSFCPLGITGQPMLDRELDEQGRLFGVGMALLGRTHLG
jgi:SagB-type dehydrogenase family enzyme